MLTRNEKTTIGIILIVFILITVSTHYYGSVDTGDYADTSKYLAGDLSSKIRASHSYLYGYIHSGFIRIFQNFFAFKITSLLSLFLIILSIYYISGYNKQALYLALLSPIVWYMGPWISPIQASALFLLWAYYFIKKYSQDESIKSLFFAGLFIGLGWAVWDTILFFGGFLAVSFLYNKKLSHFIFFCVFVLIGLLPRLILDYYLFNFPFFTILKSFLGTAANTAGGIYNHGTFHTPKTFTTLFSIFLAFPILFWALFRREIISKNKKTIIFLSLSVLLIIANPMIRYTLAIVPIMLLLIGKYSSPKQFKFQAIFSIVVILLFVAPCIIQLKYSINSEPANVDFTYLLGNHFRFYLNGTFYENELNNDIADIVTAYPNATFVVGNQPDDYQLISHSYWGHNVNEFVSIQDYQLWQENKSILYEKSFMPIPNIDERRQIWVSGGLSKNTNDRTNYSAIIYGIGLGEPLNLGNFTSVNKFGILYLSEKRNSHGI